MDNHEEVQIRKRTPDTVNIIHYQALLLLFTSACVPSGGLLLSRHKSKQKGAQPAFFETSCFTPALEHPAQRSIARGAQRAGVRILRAAL